jgi:cytochrome c oxidase subunit 4
MSSVHQHKSHTKSYVIIFVLLTVLTVLELFIPGMNISYMSKAAGLVLFALAKAFVVGYYYMHLNEETRWLKYIALIPIAAVLYFVMLVLETVYR